MTLKVIVCVSAPYMGRCLRQEQALGVKVRDCLLDTVRDVFVAARRRCVGGN